MWLNKIPPFKSLDEGDFPPVNNTHLGPTSTQRKWCLRQQDYYLMKIHRNADRSKNRAIFCTNMKHLPSKLTPKRTIPYPWPCAPTPMNFSRRECMCATESYITSQTAMVRLCCLSNSAYSDYNKAILSVPIVLPQDGGELGRMGFIPMLWKPFSNISKHGKELPVSSPVFKSQIPYWSYFCCLCLFIFTNPQHKGTALHTQHQRCGKQRDVLDARFHGAKETEAWWRKRRE